MLQSTTLRAPSNRGFSRRFVRRGKIPIGLTLMILRLWMSFTLHVGMNIAEKARLFAEVRRVLKPGGIFGIYDQMSEADGDLTFPMP